MLYEISNGILRLTIDTLGAEMQSVLGRDGTQYLWQGDAAYWTGRAKNLFPYIARLNGGKYIYDGKEYEMEIHGIAPYAEFAVEEQNGDSICFRLDASEETLRRYPFLFTYRIRYELTGSRILISSQVENRDDKTMYYAVGGHPGFNVPLERGLSFEDYYLEFEKSCRPVRIGFTKECLLDGHDLPYPLEGDRRLKLRHDLFNDDAVVLRDMDHTVTLAAKGGSKAVRVTFPDMKYLGFWHKPYSDAPYVCIEPWSSLPSRSDRVERLKEQENLLSLAAGASSEITWSIELIGA